MKKWYCVLTKPKQENHASILLRELDEVEVFCPLIRFKKSTTRGKIWFQEALFPRYIFVKFDLKTMFRVVNYSRGVASLVHFGTQYPSIPKNEIETLKRKMGDDKIIVISHKLKKGQKTRIEQGPFKGLSAVITKAMPANERVCVLLDFLGRKIEAEVKESVLATPKSRPKTGNCIEGKW